jgi:hypothetical protein
MNLVAHYDSSGLGKTDAATLTLTQYFSLSAASWSDAGGGYLSQA